MPLLLLHLGMWGFGKSYKITKFAHQKTGDILQDKHCP